MPVIQLPSGPEILLVEAAFPTTDPRTLFSYWTEPMLLERWWPQHAEVEPRVGGAYHLSWPQQNWQLRGRYTACEPGERLDFTWKWDSATSGVYPGYQSCVVEDWTQDTNSYYTEFVFKCKPGSDSPLPGQG